MDWLKRSMMFIVLTILYFFSDTTAVQKQPRNFDDYLLSVVVPESEVPREPVPVSGPDAVNTDHVTDADILGYFRDVPRQHWSCCMIGKLAGDKGFHCHAAFYAARIARHNTNRAHSRKMLFHGSNPVRNWGLDLMTTFSRCLLQHEEEFNDCCHVATLELRERQRWQTYKLSGSDDITKR